MASRNKDERAHVNALVKAIQKNSPGVYVFIDRDAGSERHTSSGWDFQIAYRGKIVYCEAKEQSGSLTGWQKFTQAQIKATGTSYYIVRFWYDGEYFTIGTGAQIKTAEASVEDFIK